MYRKPLIANARTRAGNLPAIALARIVIVAGQLALYPQTALSADAETGAAQRPASKINLVCAARDLELFSLIERNGNNGLSSTATLVETFDMLETARAACETGHTDDALALYSTALQRLENPSDIARR